MLATFYYKFNVSTYFEELGVLDLPPPTDMTSLSVCLFSFMKPLVLCFNGMRKCTMLECVEDRPA